VNIVLQCVYHFFEEPDMKGNHVWIEWQAFQVLQRSQLIFPSKTWFLRIYLNFQRRNHLKINISHILNPNPTKWITLNPAHQDLSKNTKGTFQFLQNSQLWFNIIFSEKIIQYSRTFALQIQMSWNQAHAPFLVKELSKDTKNMIWSILVWWIL
jgi:hypothetical protein